MPYNFENEATIYEAIYDGDSAKLVAEGGVAIVRVSSDLNVQLSGLG